MAKMYFFSKHPKEGIVVKKSLENGQFRLQLKDRSGKNSALIFTDQDTWVKTSVNDYFRMEAGRDWFVLD